MKKDRQVIDCVYDTQKEPEKEQGQVEKSIKQEGDA